jgi:hypothetical protein
MRQGWCWRRLAGGLLGVVLATSCAQDAAQDAAVLGPPPGEYELGGQTGSLVPECGVAPLSAGGLAVPIGDALAVFYDRGCPEDLVAERVALTGPGQRPVPLTLEALDDGVYLVRAAESLAAGSYELGVSGEASTLSVASEVSALPVQLGLLRPIASPVDCPESLEFQLVLSAEARANVPLMRWLVRVDAGDEQVWVDYGALELEGADADVATLSLPRCAGGSCLGQGSHGLRLRAAVAGEAFASEPLSIDFDVRCAESPPGSAASGSDGCSLGAPARSLPLSSTALSCVLAALVLAARRRRY